VPERASVAGHERPRLFVALVLPEAARDRLVEWQQRELGKVEGIRIVPPGNLHATIAFLGPRPAGDVPGIVAAVHQMTLAAAPPGLKPARYR
jgi:RNA 2',3'-cyclic 3'-phosphodiesterase